MLDREFIVNNRDKVEYALKVKHVNLNIEELFSYIEKRKTIINQLNNLREKRNSVSKEIANKKRAGEDISSLLEESQQIAKSVKTMQSELQEIEEKEYNLMQWIPNIPHESVPSGENAKYKIIKEFGSFEEKQFNYYDIVTKKGYIDFKRGAKLSSSHFPLYMDKGAYIERILINFMIDVHKYIHGYTEIFPPFLVNERTLFNTGQLPKLKEDMYYIQNDKLYLIPTAEPPVTGIYSNEILMEKDLPYKFVAYSASFRREAGSYGKDTKGLKRIHQFNKVELVQYAHPDNSYNTLEEMLKNAEKILQLLELDYRVILLPDNDMSFASAKTYDIEVWTCGSKEFMEVSSVSNFEDFQARRLNIRYKDKNGKNHFIHTLNGSGLATPRTLIALIEKYQTPAGDFEFPEIINDYIARGATIFDNL